MKVVLGPGAARARTPILPATGHGCGRTSRCRSARWALLEACLRPAWTGDGAAADYPARGAGRRSIRPHISTSCATARRRGPRCPGPRPRMVPNIHPARRCWPTAPSRSANRDRPAGWFTADTSCPIAAATWPAASPPPPAPSPRPTRRRPAATHTRWHGRRVITPMRRGPADIATSTTRRSRPSGCGHAVRRRVGRARYRQPPRQRHAGHLLAPRRCAVRLRCMATRPAIIPCMSATRRNVARVPGEGCNLNLPLPRGSRRCGLAGGARRRDRRDQPVRRRRAGGQPRLRRLRGRAAQLPGGDRGRLCPRRRRDRRARLPAAIIQEGGYNIDAARALSQPLPRRASLPDELARRRDAFAFSGIEAVPVEVQVQISVRPAGLPGGRPAGQGGGRGARTGARGADRDGAGAAAEAGADQSGARRPAQGRQPFRPADRACRAGRHGRAAARGHRRATRRWASCRWMERSTRRRRAAGGDRRRASASWG